MPSGSTVLQLRLDERLKQAFSEAAEREHTTPSKALRAMVEDFIQRSRRKEAERQSRLVAEAEDADAVMDEVRAAQGFRDD